MLDYGIPFLFAFHLPLAKKNLLFILEMKPNSVSVNVDPDHPGSSPLQMQMWVSISS